MLAPEIILNGRYQLTQRIAAGGMGEVWRGSDLLLHREIAVKVLLPALMADEEFITRFRTEARMMAALRHPGIVQVYDYGENATVGNDRLDFLVMEFIDGTPLSKRIQQAGRLGAAETMTMVAQVADALQAAHEAGIIHRDVKPSNLLVRPSGAIVLVDFGVARSAGITGITSTNVVMGSAHYMAPEQAEGRPVSAATDVYALGAVAFSCLAGRPPYIGDNPMAVLAQLVHGKPPVLPPEVPPAAGSVVLRALAREPEQRFPSASALADAARSVAARPSAGVYGSAAPVPPGSPVYGTPAAASGGSPAYGTPADTSGGSPAYGTPADTSGGSPAYGTPAGTSGGSPAAGVSPAFGAAAPVPPATPALGPAGTPAFGAPGSPPAFGSAAPASPAAFGAAAPVGPPAFGSATPGGPAAFGSATPASPAAFGSATPGGPAAFGSATPASPAAFGSATPGGPAAFGSATPAEPATSGDGPAWAGGQRRKKVLAVAAGAIALALATTGVVLASQSSPSGGQSQAGQPQAQAQGQDVPVGEEFPVAEPGQTVTGKPGRPDPATSTSPRPGTGTGTGTGTGGNHSSKPAPGTTTDPTATTPPAPGTTTGPTPGTTTGAPTGTTTTQPTATPTKTTAKPEPTNPYSATKVCGSGYSVIDSAALKTSGGVVKGKVYLLYQASSGKNCVVTLKTTSVGKNTSTAAFLEVKGKSRITDSGSFGYYAGPVRAAAAATCVKWGGSMGTASYASPFEHCD